ncbi:hypothetical protein ACOME3_002398 [Neoechinorhynchus agilis]
MPLNQYTLYYFDSFPRRDELIRLILIATGQMFKEVNLDKDEELTKHRLEMPSENGLALKVNDELLVNLSAIVRYLGKKHGLAGNTELDACRCDAIVFILDEYFSRLLDIAYNEAKQKGKQLIKDYTRVEIPKLISSLKRLEDLYGENGYIVSDNLTYADLSIFAFFQSLYMNFCPDVNFDYADKNREIVKTVPSLKEYFVEPKATDDLWGIVESFYAAFSCS